MFKTGQIILLRACFRSVSSVALGLVCRSPWTHVNFVVEGSESPSETILLNTYPATNATLVTAAEQLKDREFLVLDLPDKDESWREEVSKIAHHFLGFRYWLSPCSRLSALAVMKAGIHLYDGARPSWRLNAGLLLPGEFLTRTRFKPVRDLQTL